LHFGVKYYWHVRALHVGDVSDWSETWDFTTINSIVLLSPADNATDISLSPLLDWEDATGISNYYTELSDKADFSNLLVSGTIPADQSYAIVPLVLDKETTYYWRVRAENGLDISGWSPTWKFTTLPPVGVDEQAFENKFSIFPNPADKTVFIEFTNEGSKLLLVTITDVLGVKVIEEELQGETGYMTIPINVGSLQSGIYLLRIADKENSFTKKIVIKR